ncbi:Uma2 family endonuclease [Phormidium tenue FACHB-886]|nr:Uma2 family endonuclease [Phormidium tenue FACHB-886]
MTQAAVRPRVSFEEYIDFCAQTDEPYELVRGELVKMTPPTWAHVLIARFLERVFETEIERLGYDWVAVRESGQRTEQDSSRLPDVTVVPFDEIEPVLNQTAVLAVPAPIVVEIVSPSSSTEDYDAKLKEYQLLGVKEYWVVDHEGLGAAKHVGSPKAPTITIYELIEGQYQSRRFREEDQLQSPTFSLLSITANQVFAAARRKR